MNAERMCGPSLTRSEDCQRCLTTAALLHAAIMPLSHSLTYGHGFAAHGLSQARRRNGRQFASGGAAAKGYTPPAEAMARSGGAGAVRAIYFSPNLIVEPYRGPPPPLPVSSWFTAEGWKTRWKRILGRMKNIYTLARVRKDVADWSLGGFKKLAAEMHGDISQAIASGDSNKLRHLLTDSVLTDVKRELRAREQGGWTRVSWSLDSMDEVSLVHARLMAPNEKDTSTAFAQLTIEFQSTQRFEAFDARNKRVVGDASKPVKVAEFWVFERGLGSALPSQMHKWRLAARLSQPGT